MNLLIMTPSGAAKRQFPRNPQPGQIVYSDGQAWAWYPPSSLNYAGLGDINDGLGFWGALIGAVTGLAPLFMGGKSKGVSPEQAQAEVDKARLEEQLKAAQAPRGAEAIFNKKTLPYWTILILGFVALR